MTILITQLSPSGEIAQFIDDDQFDWGLESTMKCGPEAVALVWHSVQPGKENPYHAADIHRMASEDYARFIGPDTPGDGGGTSNQTLYAMLSFHGLHYIVVPTIFEVIRAWITLGYPVICGVVEASVIDRELNRSPYPWNDLQNLTHIITATGLADGSWLKFRDTANVEFNGNPNILRPGPREYNLAHISLTSATVVVPSWLQVPPVNFDPRSVISPTPTIPSDELSLWGHFGDIPLNPDAAIYKSWLAGYFAGKQYGPPLSPEHIVAGKTIQEFMRARAEWTSGQEVQWHDARGLTS